MTSAARTKARLVSIDGSPLAVIDTEATGVPIVFCHGLSCSSRCFDRQLESDLGDDFRLIAFDLPGHGDSGRAATPATDYTLAGWADTLTKFVDALSATGGIFVGWSLGGHILLEASGRLTARGLVIVGTPPIRLPLPPNAFRPAFAMAPAFSAESTDEDRESFLRTFFRPGTAVPTQFRRDFDRTDPAARAAVGASLKPGGCLDEIEIVAHLHRPLAILHGQDDALVNREYFETLTMPTLWRGAVQDIADSGHAPHWENPRAFNALLRAAATDWSA